MSNIEKLRLLIVDLTYSGRRLKPAELYSEFVYHWGEVTKKAFEHYLYALKDRGMVTAERHRYSAKPRYHYEI